MHIFLTGEIQVGKSTIIRDFLSRSGLSTGGFATYWEPNDGGGRSLYLAPYRADLRAGDGQLVLRIADGKFVFRAGDGKFVLRTAEGKLLLRAADGKLVPRASEGKPLPPENAESITHIFDTYGKEILDGSGNRDITIMDELGFFESGALAFQQAVMRRISGGIPTLGVIKPRHTEFLDAVRAHEGVEIWEVDESNRAAVLTRLLEREWR